MVELGFKEKQALNAGKKISTAFVNPKDLEGKKEGDTFQETMLKMPIRLSGEEIQAVDDLVDKLASEKRIPEDDELDFLRKTHRSVDIAMFGRMLASKGKLNVKMEAAVQVAHAFTVNAAKADDDYFTAVEDLNDYREDEGSAFIGESGFGSGVYYLYLCINKTLLIENLQGDETLANETLTALVEACTKVSPTGKQNSFASRAYTSYLMAEKGSQQPRSLSVAFFKPVKGEDQLDNAINTIEEQKENFDKAYGKCADDSKAMNAQKGEGSLQEIIEFVTE